MNKVKQRGIYRETVNTNRDRKERRESKKGKGRHRKIKSNTGKDRKTEASKEDWNMPKIKWKPIEQKIHFRRTV